MLVNQLKQFQLLANNISESNNAMMDRLSRIVGFKVQLVSSNSYSVLIKVRTSDCSFFDSASIIIIGGRLDVIDYRNLSTVDVYIFTQQLLDIPTYSVGYYSSIIPHSLIEPFQMWFGGLDCKKWFSKSKYQYFYEMLLAFDIDISRRYDGKLPNA